MDKNNEKTTFCISAEFVFRGNFKIKATSRQEAHDLVDKYAGMTISGGIEFDPTIDEYKADGGVDWEFDSHAEKRITHT
jgi:hypothetical protein